MFRVILLGRNCEWPSLSSFGRARLKIIPFVNIMISRSKAKSFMPVTCQHSTVYLPIQTTKFPGKQILQYHETHASMLSRSCSDVPQFYIQERDVNEEIMSKSRVQDHLEFYHDNKDRISLVNSITLLHRMAKIAHKYSEEKELLLAEMAKVKQGRESPYIDMLDFIAENISSCKAQGLANVMWSLGKLEEITHSLVRVCEEEILSHDFALFHTSEINQILTGCAGLGLRESAIFERVQESILKEIIRISLCENRQIAGILLAFTKVGCGSVELYEHIEYEIARRGIKAFHNGQVAQFLYSFASQGMYSSILFDIAEEEILRRSTARLQRRELVLILWSFATAGRGSEDLFCLLGKEIADNKVRELYNIRLIWIIWSFATRGITDNKVYKVIASEIYGRGLKSLTNCELSLCMYSYALSEIPCHRFMEELSTEVLSRDSAHFDGGQLAQVSWALGKVGLTNPSLYSNLEQQILKLKISENEAAMISEGFRSADMGSKELFSHLESVM